MNSVTPVDGATFRRVLSHYPTGVCVVTAIEADGMPIGFAVGSFTSVSLAPPLVAYFVDRCSVTWPRIEKVGRFCVNILSTGQTEVCRRFARSGGDKFAGQSYRLSPHGSPLLNDVVAWIDCSLHAVFEAGDHYIVLGQVIELEAEATSKPLLFFQGRYGRPEMEA